jgi:DNA polymerase-4
VSTTRIEKSIGHEETFHDDISDRRILRAELLRLSDRVGARLRENGWEARTVSIKVRFADFSTFTRAQTLTEPTDVGQRIGAAARDLLDALEMRMAIRLIGVRAEKLVPAGGTGAALWDDDEEWRRIEGALDGAAARFGSGAVTRASFLKPGRAIGALPSNPLVPKQGDG